MNVLGEGSQLTYENFIYIAMTATFASPEAAGRTGGGSGLAGQDLVLDVEGTRVFLGKKQAGKRSQLWRMTPTGMLQHEGSSAPQDPTSASAAASASAASAASGAASKAALLANLDRAKNALVLDIAGPAVQPTQQVSWHSWHVK